jgi:alkylated DNA repair protein (DNA oxidative demethylase)
MTSMLDGVRLVADFLDQKQQETLLVAVRNVVRQAPLYVPHMPKSGKAMSVRMTNCGTLGWITDKEHGYRYQRQHPETGKPWPAIPAQLMEIWNTLANCSVPPEACLINFYDANAKMGMHQDRDEENRDAPILSLSLGDDCLFRVGDTKRGGPTNSFRLKSGDALLLEGPARIAYHGVDKIYSNTSTLLKNGGRINLTLRRVSKAQ